jgi:hypothetical protein
MVWSGLPKPRLYEILTFCMDYYIGLHISPCIRSIIWSALPKPSQIRVIYEVLGVNTLFKVLASYNHVQYVLHFILVIMFVKVSKYPKSLNLTNIVLVYIVMVILGAIAPPYIL